MQETVMMSSQHYLNEPAARRRSGRLQLILLVGLVIGPMMLATAMFYGRFWVPEGRNYHGEMINGAYSQAQLGIPFAPGKGWQLLVTTAGECAEDCQQLVYLARQINIGLGREASRANHGLALSRPLPLELSDQWQREYPRLLRYPLELSAYEKVVPDSEAAQLWIVDPLGNLVLRYSPAANGKDILTDLRLLLKLSNIG